jgi:hypothetical protein
MPGTHSWGAFATLESSNGILPAGFATSIRPLCSRNGAFWRLRRRFSVARSPSGGTDGEFPARGRFLAVGTATIQRNGAFRRRRRRFSAAWRLKRSGNLKAAEWFPDGCYPPALPFNGDPRPPRPPSPPTRSITVLESGAVERGEIPVVVIPARVWSTGQKGEKSWQAVEPRARGQPP